MLTDPTTQTLAVGLYSFVSQAFLQQLEYLRCRCCSHTAVPVMIVFLLLQKYIVRNRADFRLGEVRTAEPAHHSRGPAVLDRTMSSNGSGRARPVPGDEMARALGDQDLGSQFALALRGE
jgi:hypothetical protein